MAEDEKVLVDANDVSSSSLMPSKNKILSQVTAAYLDTIDLNNIPEPWEIESSILADTKVEFDLQNAIRGKGDKWRLPQELIPSQIADIILRLYPVANISCAGEKCGFSL